MTTIGQNEGEQKSTLRACKCKRLEVEGGDSVGYIKYSGSCTQKAAATIFDYDGDGKYDHSEAWSFNHSRITHDPNKGEIRLYYSDEPKDAKPSKIVDIEQEEKDYEERCAKFQKFAQTLTRYGIDVEMARNAGVTDCEVKEKDGKTVLVLHAAAEGYELELPIDKDFEPKSIKIFRSEDDFNIHFNNVNGTLKCLYGDFDYGQQYGFGGNSNITVIGFDGAPESMAVENNAKVTFVTGDYADSIVDRTRKDSDGNSTVTNLKPGKTTIQGAGTMKGE